MSQVAETLASPGTQIRHLVVSVDTREPFEIVDLTPVLSRAIDGLGFRDGVLTLHTRHTTTGLLINEHEPLLFCDLQAFFERIVPATAGFAHDDFERRTVNLTPDERQNGWAHCRAALLRTSESVPVADRDLCLGRWQRVLLVEFDGPRRREVSVVMLGAFAGLQS